MPFQAALGRKAALLVLLLVCILATAAWWSFERVPEGSVQVVLGPAEEVREVRRSGPHWGQPPGRTVLYGLEPVRLREEVRLLGAEGDSWEVPVEAEVRLRPEAAGSLWESTRREEPSEAMRVALRQAMGEAWLPRGGEEAGEEAETAVRRALASRGLEVLRLDVGDPVPWTSESGSAEAPTGEKILLVGLDGADWQVIDRLIGEGRLSVLARLKKEGAWAELRSDEPMLSPILWTTVATGRAPADHGVLDFLMWDPVLEEKVPISSRFRRVPAFWNLGEAFGFPTTTIAWWGTWPAEEVRGELVSDRFAYTLFREVSQVEEGLTWPPTLGEELHPLRLRPEELEPADLARLVDLEVGVVHEVLAGDPGDGDAEVERLHHLREILASQITYHRVALHLLEDGQPPLFAVYYQGIDEVGHLFGHLLPPRLPWVEEHDHRRYAGVLDAWYERQDAMLGELLAAVDPGTTVMLLSDHGFRTGEDRPPIRPSELKGRAAAWHRLYGVFLMRGPHIRPGRLDTMRLHDVLPTALYLLGVPLSRELEGAPRLRAFTPAFRGEHQIARVDSWAGSSRPAERPDGTAALDERVLARLETLGYLGGADEAPREPSSGEGSGTALYHANRGSLLLGERRFAEAIEAYEEALSEAPRFPEAHLGLAAALAGAGRVDEALTSAREGATRFPTEAGAFLALAGRVARSHGRAGEHLAWLHDERGLADAAAYLTEVGLTEAALGRSDEAARRLREATEADPTHLPAVRARAELLRQEGEPEAALRIVDRALEANSGAAVLHHLRGRLRRAAGREAEALDSFREAVRLAPDHPGYLSDLGATLGRAGRSAEAEEVLRRAWRLAPSSYEVLVNLGATLASRGRPEEALSFLSKAEGLAPEDPRLLNALGSVYLETGRLEEARTRFERSLRHDPEQEDVRRLLERWPEVVGSS